MRKLRNFATIAIVAAVMATPASANWFKKNLKGFVEPNCWEFLFTAGQAGNKGGKKCKVN